MSLISRHLRAFPKLRNNYVAPKRYLQTQVHPQHKMTLGEVSPVFRFAPQLSEKIALKDAIGRYTYGNLCLSAKELSREISAKLGGKTNERVLFMCPNDANYVIILWAIWMSGQIAVPLSPLHPQNVLLYYANDCRPELLITTPKYADLMHRVSKNTHIKLHTVDEKIALNAATKVPSGSKDLEAGHPTSFYDKNNALILYTSGTTGNPKGVVLTHRNLVSQVNMLLDAWKWSQGDVMLHSLPLHHVHGIVNALLCPLSAGAKTIMLPKFDANTVWSHLLGVSAKPEDRKITVYMAVPTVYSKLIDEYNKVFGGDPKMVEYIKNTLKNKIRLMVSGSAPLPVTTFNKWLEISGHRLLERYGMTEIGMCLSNFYDGRREPGYVGVPLPGVSVRLAQPTDKNDYQTVLECTNNNGKLIFQKNDKLIKDLKPAGELLVRSEGVFKEYFNRPEATKQEFTSDHYFKTGDMCQYSFEMKMFKMLGRKSVDIIKSGGYKLSALQIETELLSNPSIKECVVVGVPDDKWGEKVATIVVFNEGQTLTLEELREWGSEKLPKYSLPTVMKVLDCLPKNTMGKVSKKELVKNVFADFK